VADPTNVHAAQRVEYYGAPIDSADVAALVVHGRAQHPEWMREFLIGRLPADVFDRVAFVAPEAAENTWYPGGFMQPFADNEPHLTWALERVDELVGELEASGHDRADLRLIGFSQGACLLSEYIARRPARYGGVAALTGGLIGPPGTAWDGPSLESTPVLLATSDIDEWVPIGRVAETRDVLTRRGADVHWRVYDGMGHIINDDEVALVADMLRGGIGS
jgi:predicted esterase